MSSETSTSAVRLKPDTTAEDGARLQPDHTADGGVRLQPDHSLHPWQFFVLAALGCATAVTFMARGRGVTSIILLSVVMGAAALVGIAALRTLRPLVSAEDDRTVVIGRRTRAALEREKVLALRTIKELEFDRAMGKLSDEDWKEMSTRLRARAARLMRQLDAGEGYRSEIERELEKRLGDAGSRLKPSRDEDANKDRDADARLKPSRYEDREDPDGRSAAADGRSATALAERLCASCSTVNDSDARFCKSCGNKL